MLTASDIPAVLAIGLGSGLVGGLLGFGGSVLMIPLLTSVLDRGQHLSQAAAMIVNAVIAAPALWRHHRAGAVRWPLVWRMLPFAIIAILLGVEIGNRMESGLLRTLFGVFLVYVVVFDVAKIIWRRLRSPKPHEPHAPASLWRAGSVGGTVGVLAGILGIGGGPVAVPMLQWVCHRSLHQAIAASTALMCLTSCVGAVRKNLTLNDVSGVTLAESLQMAGWLAPTAAIGAWVGASLTHQLPGRWVRAILLCVLTWSAIMMFTGA